MNGFGLKDGIRAIGRCGWSVLTLCICLSLSTHAQAATYTRTEQITYEDNPSEWVVGQVKSVTCMVSVPASTVCNGDVMSETTYHPVTALPTATSLFGKLQHTLAYYADGTVRQVTDGRGYTTTLSNWKRGIPQAIGYPATPDQPSGESQSAIVDNNGWITSTTNGNGDTTRHGYDAMGRLNLIDYPDGDTVAWTSTNRLFSVVAGVYGLPNHWRLWERAGNGYKLTHYDALWRPVVEETYVSTDATNTRSIVVKRYDDAGRLAFQSYPIRTLVNWSDVALKGTHTSYDALDRPLAVIQDSELGPLTTTTRYLAGFKTEVINPRLQKTTTSYLAWDQPTFDYPVAIVHPEGAYTDISRDPFGKPRNITRRNADNTQWNRRYISYYPSQEICETTEVETGTTAYGYDAAGNLVWSAAALPWSASETCDYTANDSWVGPRKVARSYDARNRILSLVFPDHRGDTTHHYTPDGKLSSITADDGSTPPVTTEYTYNKRGLLEDERLLWGNIDWTIDYTWNGNGHLDSQRSPIGLVVDYAPNALGQPTRAGSYAANVSYYPNGAIKQFTYGNGIVHAMTQNARQLPERSRDVYGSTVFLDDSYDYDKNGNVVGISDALPEHRGDRTMTYDGLDRLFSATSPMFPGGTAYRYDVLDNLTRVVAPGRNHWYCYDNRWRLTNVKNGPCDTGSTVIGLGYDVRGNLDNKNGQTFDFDYGNRLRSVSGSPASYYVYDGHGRRVRDYTTTSRYNQYSQSGQLVFARDDRQSKWLDHVYLGGSLVAIRERDGVTGVYTTKYQHTDALGSPVAVTSQARTVLERREYEPYGRQLRPTAPVDGPGFTGHVLDAATGLNYMQQRYYDPGIGRFLSVDPVAANPNTGASFNRYNYANNNPYRFTDPDGRQAMGSPREMMNPVTQEQARTLAPLIADFTPVVGDVKGIAEAIQDPSAANIAGAAVGLVPGVGDVAGKVIKNADKVGDVVRKTSKIDRAEFAKERKAFWKAEAKSNSDKYSAGDLAKMDKGRAPTGPDGHPMELHHKDGTPEGGVTPMSRTDHRLGENYKKNHDR